MSLTSVFAKLGAWAAKNLIPLAEGTIFGALLVLAFFKFGCPSGDTFPPAKNHIVYNFIQGVNINKDSLKKAIFDSLKRNLRPSVIYTTVPPSDVPILPIAPQEDKQWAFYFEKDSAWQRKDSLWLNGKWVQYTDSGKILFSGFSDCKEERLIGTTIDFSFRHPEIKNEFHLPEIALFSYDFILRLGTGLGCLLNLNLSAEFFWKHWGAFIMPQLAIISPKQIFPFVNGGVAYKF